MSLINAIHGGVTHNSIRIAAAVTSSAPVRIAIDADPALTAPLYVGPFTPDASGYVVAEVAGLDSGARYHWAVEHDGVLDAQFPGTFLTVPGAPGEQIDFTFWASTCAGLNPETPGVGDVLAANRLTNHRVFELLAQRAVAEGWLFGIHGGDVSYYDLGSGNHGIIGGGSLANYRRMFNDVLAQPLQHLLYRSCPVVILPDDHCRGPNDHNRTYAGGANYEAVYRQRIPSYALEESSGAVYHSWQVGRVLFIGADTRNARDPNSDPQTPAKTMLGAAQRAWMDALLSTTDAELLCWVMPSQWLGTATDGWASFTDERDQLVKLFAAPGGDPTRNWLPRMFGVSGDSHTNGIASAAGQPFGNFPWFQFAALDSSFAEPLPWFNVGASAGRGQYGVIGIRDHGHTIAVTATGYQMETPVMEHTFNVYVGGATAVALDYGAGHISEPFEPVDDDQSTRNDVTASRSGGNSVQVEQTDGPLNVADPPAGVGRYDTSTTVNVAADQQLGSQAAWRVHLGTVDEARYPTVRVDLAANPDLIPDMAALDVGDALTIDNPPPNLPPGRIEQLAQGFTESIGVVGLDVTANCSPASPWRTGTYDTDRYDTAGTETTTAVDAVQTEIVLKTVKGPRWIQTGEPVADFPFNIIIGGEVMTVASIVDEPGDGLQRFTVTRSVNGIAKPHPVGASAALANPAVYAL